MRRWKERRGQHSFRRPSRTAQYDIGVSATDPAGNTGTSNLIDGLVIDTIAPAVSISAPTTAITAGGPVSYTVTYTDANAMNITLAAGDITLNAPGETTATGSIDVSGTGNTHP